jgi:hypothetical protein
MLNFQRPMIVIPSEVEEWSGWGSRDMDGKAEG